MTILGLFLLLGVYAKPPCPNVTCGWLKTGSCAEFTERGFAINGNPPGENRQCRLFDIFPSYWNPNYTQSSVGDSEIVEKALDNDIGISCPIRRNDTNFINGGDNSTLWDMSTKKECNTKRHCEKKNKEFGDCVCGLDSKFYCLPDPSSDAFAFFWEECHTYDNYSRFSVWRKWQYATIYWVMNATAHDLACASQLTEIGLMRENLAGKLATAVVLTLISL